MADMEKGWLGNNSWIRGACQYGIMPANGMLYAPPDACGCFNKVKVQGFFAVGPARENKGGVISDIERLRKAPHTERFLIHKRLMMRTGRCTGVMGKEVAGQEPLFPES
ncbi:MAG: hypothetical protein ACYSU5_09325 [Planctomycetota bacterium]